MPSINYNILNKISDKYIEQQLSQYYVYVYHQDVINEEPAEPIVVKGETEDEIYMKIFSNNANIMRDFIYHGYNCIENLRQFYYHILDMYEIDYRSDINDRFFYLKYEDALFDYIFDRSPQDIYHDLDGFLGSNTLTDLAMEFMDKLINDSKAESRLIIRNLEPVDTVEKSTE